MSISKKFLNELDNNFNITFGDKGTKNTWQAPFPPTVKCSKCGGECRPAANFTERKKANEIKAKNHLAKVHNFNRDGGLWPHDFVAIQTYFCKKCLNIESEYNQA